MTEQYVGVMVVNNEKITFHNKEEFMRGIQYLLNYRMGEITIRFQSMRYNLSAFQ